MYQIKGEFSVAMGKMPRSFWSYTAGKGSMDAEEREAKRGQMIQALKETIPGLLGFGVVLVLALIMLLMMFAEFRGLYIIEQFWDLFRVR